MKIYWLNSGNCCCCCCTWPWRLKPCRLRCFRAYFRARESTILDTTLASNWAPSSFAASENRSHSMTAFSSEWPCTGNGGLNGLVILMFMYWGLRKGKHYSSTRFNHHPFWFYALSWTHSQMQSYVHAHTHIQAYARRKDKYSLHAANFLCHRKLWYWTECWKGNKFQFILFFSNFWLK